MIACRTPTVWIALLAVAVVLAAVVRGEETEHMADVRHDCVPGEHLQINAPPEPDPRAPDRFTVTWTTTISDTPLVVEVFREWSPLGVDRFYQLAKDNYFNCGTFFRVVPNFVVQFGIAAEPDETAKWDYKIPDDPVIQSNLEGYLTFATAGADTRTTQLFINLADNQDALDNQGFSAFGKVIGGYIDNARNVRNPTPNNSGGIDQTPLEEKGTKWVLKNHPKIDMILTTKVTVPGEDEGTAAANDDGTENTASKPITLETLDITKNGPMQISMLVGFIVVECVFGYMIWMRR